MFRIEFENPLPSQGKDRYAGLAYDGCWLYLTLSCECKVLQIDTCFHQERCYDTCRIYHKICYDTALKCFWASSDQSVSNLYKLNDCFQEVDCIHIRNADVCGGVVTGISYQCCQDALLVSFAAGVVRIDKTHPRESTTVLKSSHGWFMGIVSVCPYLVCYCLEENQREIRVYNSRGTLVKKAVVSGDSTIESAVFFPCTRDFRHCHFYVLVGKHSSYPYLMDCVLECNELCENICACNYKLCGQACCRDRSCDDRASCSEAIKSIASVQAAIAHILNAEGEKIQKVLATSDCVCEILEANQSVNQTLVRATNLEQAVYYNLELLKCCCPTWEEACCSAVPPPKPDGPC